MYDHLGGGRSDAVYDSATAEAFAAGARRSVADGFDALKVLAVPRSRPLEGAAAVRDAVDLMGAVRDAVGEDVDVMIDLHGRTTPAMAIQYGLALAPLHPWFLEEPCRPDDIPGLIAVSRAVPIPIAAGERLVTRRGFREVFEQRGVAVAQPDVCHAGGITELRKIAAYADVHDIAVAPHNPLGPIATMVNIHLAFATPNHLVQEVMRSDVPWRDEIVDAPLVLEKGRALPPTRAGIGIEVDEAAAARHPYVPEPQVRWWHSDGSVADW
jgi:galactonate dehydratase